MNQRWNFYLIWISRHHARKWIEMVSEIVFCGQNYTYYSRTISTILPSWFLQFLFTKSPFPIFSSSKIWKINVLYDLIWLWGGNNCFTAPQIYWIKLGRIFVFSKLFLISRKIYQKGQRTIGNFWKYGVEDSDIWNLPLHFQLDFLVRKH